MLVVASNDGVQLYQTSQFQFIKLNGDEKPHFQLIATFENKYARVENKMEQSYQAAIEDELKVTFRTTISKHRTEPNGKRVDSFVIRHSSFDIRRQRLFQHLLLKNFMVRENP